MSFSLTALHQVASVAIMFIFAILFFGIMQDVGLFDPLINKMISTSRGNVIAVAVATVIIAAIAHLDGSGASTFLITIPALLPLYKRLKMNPYLLLMLVGTAATIVNMRSLGRPTWENGLGTEYGCDGAVETTHPIQMIGLVLLMALAVTFGYREKRLIAKRASAGEEAKEMKFLMQRF